MMHDGQDARRDPSDKCVAEAELFEQESTFCDFFVLPSGVIGSGHGTSPARTREGQQSERALQRV